MTVPTIWVGPVRSHCMPMTISPFDWAWDRGAPARPPAATRSDVRMARKNRIVVLLSSRTSVREWPDPEIVADIPPQAVQPLGLDDEEEDDEGAEHHEAEVGDEVEHGLGGEEDATERLHGEADDDGKEGDEDGAQHGAQNRPEPADDDHGEVVDGHVDLELLVVGDAEKIRAQHTGDAGIERGYGKGQQLVAEDVDADDLGGDVLVADSDEGAAHPAAHEIEGPHDGQDHEHEQEIV